MAGLLDSYAEVAGGDVIRHLQQLSEPLQGMKVVHVNSTRLGGGVAEILTKLVPLTRELNIDARWEVITGDGDFFKCTKSMHNALQGMPANIPARLLDKYLEINAQHAEELRPTLEEADFVFIHDPQPAALLHFCPNRKGSWFWRCHIDASQPYRPVWKFLRHYITEYDASIFSLAKFSQSLPHPQYIIPPSIDPLSDKNMELSREELEEINNNYQLMESHPLLLQISRFDRFKDPIGVINAYKMARRFIPSIHLILAGGEATDDPEGAEVLEEVRQAAADDDNIQILLLPPDAHRIVNGLQRLADIIIQKSTKEGFGLTVTEGLWKSKPVIGGNTGGICQQVIDHQTGYLVNSPEGAALRIRYLLHNPNKLEEISAKAKEFVRENFLLTRQLREHLTLMVGMLHGVEDRIVLG
ncbi:MAG: glycosyltransferase [Thermodesulfobacteriota bacterium]